MTEREKIAIIFNPFSGRKKVHDLPFLIDKHLNKDIFEAHLFATQKAEDLTIFTQNAINNNFDIVVAAGGDGTIHNIASKLINTKTALSIIPLGSGNGLARHLKIPLDTAKAIAQLNTAIYKKIDTIAVNEHFCVNIAGIGYDGLISHAFAKKKKRGLMGYMQVIASNLPLKSNKMYLYENNILIWSGNAIMCCIANATQWGNNVKLNKNARLDDGILNISIIKSLSPLALPGVIYKTLSGNLSQSAQVANFEGSEYRIESDIPLAMHIDGEPIYTTKKVEIKINPASLNIFSQ